jgi:hypothetical protein
VKKKEREREHLRGVGDASAIASVALLLLRAHCCPLAHEGIGTDPSMHPT